MKFSYNWLKELTGFKDSPEELAEFLTLRVFEVEGLEKTGNDWMLDIKLLPNRLSDASGHMGMAQEIASLKNTRIKNQESRIAEDKKQKTSDFVKTEIEDPDDCPRYTARVMTDVNVGPSPAWMRERLTTCGLQSINNIVDAANYVMLETGQPLHVFDMQKLKSENEKVKTIIVRRAKKGEVMPALDDKTYELNPEMLVIADEKNPLAIAGIKGGRASGVSATTHTIILESANFDPVRIRLASQTLGLRTDASLRFEHGMDPNQTAVSVNRLAELIRQVAGGIILKGVADAYPRKSKPVKILFRPEYAERLIGAAIPLSFYKNAFQRLEWQATSSVRRPTSNVSFIVTPPTNRRDIAIEEDIIEEVARLYDYKNIAAVMPKAALSSTTRNDDLFWEERVRDILTGAGFMENMLYEFIGDKELAAFGVRKENLLQLQNPPNPETKYLVPRTLIKYISSVAENLHNEDSVSIFGIAKSFSETGNMKPEIDIGERKDLVILNAARGSSGQEQFYELKGTVDQLLESLGINDYWYDDAMSFKFQVSSFNIFHPYRMAEIKIGDEKIGVIGEIRPGILESIKSRARIAAAELDFEKLAALATGEAEYRPTSKYPAIIRDIAVAVPARTRTQDVENIISAAGGDLLSDTDLFDYFQDSAMRDSEEKSLAFHLVFQSPDRTLTDAQIDAAVKKVIAALEEKTWEVRK